MAVTTLPAAGWYHTSPTNGQMRDAMDAELEVIRENLGGRDFTQKTIDVNGAITVDGPYHVVETYGSGSTDDLVSLGTSAQVGHFVLLRPYADTRDVVLKHNGTSGDGKMYLQGGKDFTMSSWKHSIMLYRAATNSWQEVARCYGDSVGLTQMRTDWGVLSTASPQFTGSITGPYAVLTNSSNTLQLGAVGASKMTLGPASLQAKDSADAPVTMTLQPSSTVTTQLKYGNGNFTVWHAGNDGTGSLLDADFLDGWHADDIVNPKFAYVMHSPTSGTAGQAAGGGGWVSKSWDQKVDLNTITSGTTPSIVLQAGTYRASGYCVCSATNAFRTRLRDVTNSTTLAVGSNAYSGASDTSDGISYFRAAPFTLSAAASLELQFYTSAGLGNCGRNSASGERELYSLVEIVKLSL